MSRIKFQGKDYLLNKKTNDVYDEESHEQVGIYNPLTKVVEFTEESESDSEVESEEEETPEDAVRRLIKDLDKCLEEGYNERYDRMEVANMKGARRIIKTLKDTEDYFKYLKYRAPESLKKELSKLIKRQDKADRQGY